MLYLDDFWTWDFWTIREGESYHLFFLKAPKSLGDPELRHGNARIGHARSRDLVEWDVLDDALAPGEPGDWDDRATWTGSVVRVGRQWHLYYTGVSSRENGLVQRIGRALSDDLVNWEKDAGFVLEADPRWYEQLDPAVWFDLTWRDPWVYRDEEAGEYRMLITARAKSGEIDSRGVIGLARSANGVRWEVLAPIAEPGEFGHLEVPQLHQVGSLWYLFFSAYRFAHGAARTRAGLAVTGTHYLVGESPRGPFRLSTPHFFSGDEHGQLYAGRVERDPAGRLVFLAFLQFVDGGPFLGGLSDPIPIEVDERGELRLALDPAWPSEVLLALGNRVR